MNGAGVSLEVLLGTQVNWKFYFFKKGTYWPYTGSPLRSCPRASTRRQPFHPVLSALSLANGMLVNKRRLAILVVILSLSNAHHQNKKA